MSSETDGLPRRLAFYLPQFHRTVENDAFHGAGYTEWTQIVQGTPHFPRHHQPVLPGELGFYDLRVPETRSAQAALAKEHGISGFCYYHYWHGGERLLHRPLDDVLASGEPDLPFCLLWANHDWRRKWHGSDDELLVDLTHSEEDDRAHIRWLLEVFRDPRYIRIQGRPVFGIYLPKGLPDPLRTITVWREEAVAAGEESPWFIAFEASHVEVDRVGDPRVLGFDASAEFPPHQLSELLAFNSVPPMFDAEMEDLHFDYAETIRAFSERPDPEWIRYRCVAPGWDNSARRPHGGALILKDETPEMFGAWLRETLREERDRRGHDGIVFINAWNEWAEAAMLEPDSVRGRARLEATRAAVMALGGELSDRATSRVEGEIFSPDDIPFPALWEKAVALQHTLSGFTAAAHRRQQDVVRRSDEAMARLRQDNEDLLAIIDRRGIGRARRPLREDGHALRSVPTTANEDAGTRYLALLKQVLTRSLFLNDAPGNDAEAKEKLRRSRSQGLDWPDEAETMIGLARLDHLEWCIKTVLEEGIPGDLLEAGVWRGGASIFMAAALEVFGDTSRRVIAADSFRGLPTPDAMLFPQDLATDLSKYEILAVSLEQVKANFERYGLLSDRVIFLEGLFKDTLPIAPVQEIAILRADGDYYESTIQILEALYDRVPSGGFVILDDYWIVEQSRMAVTDFRSARSITAELHDIDSSAVYWRRP